jgi:hypothetical protein
VFNKCLINKNKLPIKIAFLDNNEWVGFLEKEYKFKAKEFQEVRIQSLVNKSGKSYKECGFDLHKRTHEIQIEQLMKKLGKSREECIKLYSEKGEDIIDENHLKGYGFSFDDAYIELVEK